MAKSLDHLIQHLLEDLAFGGGEGMYNKFPPLASRIARSGQPKEASKHYLRFCAFGHEFEPSADQGTGHVRACVDMMLTDLYFRFNV